jgi:hypothetical protein
MPDSIPSCPEGCENTTPPYCHCISCGETGVPLNKYGLCEDCSKPKELGVNDY